MGIVWSLRFLPTTLASVALLAQPLGTALLGWWLLGERLGPLHAAGIALASRK
jgi:drug/metabolite transporter (DMT)-like permease